MVLSMWPYKSISHIQVWLLFYFFPTSPINLKIKNANTWETTNSKPPGPIIMVAWSETTESSEQQSVAAAGVSQIIFLLVGTRDLRTLWGTNATCQPLPFLSYREKGERRPSSGTRSYLYLDSFFGRRETTELGYPVISLFGLFFWQAFVWLCYAVSSLSKLCKNSGTKPFCWVNWHAFTFLHPILICSVTNSAPVELLLLTPSIQKFKIIDWNLGIEIFTKFLQIFYKILKLICVIQKMVFGTPTSHI